MSSFDRKFGKTLFGTLPDLPGIYRFFDEEGKLIYVGKAKNLRRRIGQYRNVKRSRRHAKMRKILSEARRLEHEICATEADALLSENRWIQTHRPKWNVSGAFSFLYPMLGVFMREGVLYLCYTTTPTDYPEFSLHGAFRSRERTKEGFFALTELLRCVGHPVSSRQLLKCGFKPSTRGRNYLYAFRQVDPEWAERFEQFFRGSDFGAIEALSLTLLERPSARARAKETQASLYAIRRFWRHEIVRLREACRQVAWTSYPVPQSERDRIFIAYRAGLDTTPDIEVGILV